MKMLHNLGLACGAAALVLSSVAPVSAAEVDSEKIIRAAYDRLSSYSALAEQPISFQLSDFRNLDASELTGMRYVDLVDMPSGSVVDVHRAFKTNESINQRRVVYEPSWRDMEPAWKASPEADRLAYLTAAEVLTEVTDDKGKSQLASIQAVTAFTVLVELGSESRTYDSAFLWTPSKRQSGYDTAFIVVDNITQGVEEALREPVAPLVNRDFMQLTGDLAAPNKASCGSWSQNYYDSRTAQSSSSHFWGEHKSQANFRITCSCDSGCTSRCAASMTSGSCQDSGTPSDMCHKMASASDASTSLKFGGGAACSVGYGCVQRPCLFCLCGLSVSVSANGASVSFSSGNANWTGNVKFEQSSCPPCN